MKKRKNSNTGFYCTPYNIAILVILSCSQCSCSFGMKADSFDMKAEQNEVIAIRGELFLRGIDRRDRFEANEADSRVIYQALVDSTRVRELKYNCFATFSIVYRSGEEDVVNYCGDDIVCINGKYRKLIDNQLQDILNKHWELGPSNTLPGDDEN